jgi:HlyD family secretion protein
LRALLAAQILRKGLAVTADYIIISRMIKNSAGVFLVLGAALLMWGCKDERRIDAEDHLQGVVELDERVLALEMGGRVQQVSVRRGDVVSAGQLLITLDDELEATARSARAAEAEAAKSQTALLVAGTRPEDVRSMASQVKSARASEQLLEKMLAREITLLQKRVSTQAAVDDLESRRDAARANRQSLEHKLSALRRGARPEEIETAKARASAAEKTVKLQDEKVDRYVLRAPIAGTVLDVHVEQGEVIGAGTPVVTLGDTQRPYVDVFVPTDKLHGISVGSAGTVRVDGSDQAFVAEVDWIARKTEFTPRYLFSERERPNLVVRVRLVIADPEERLHAGVPAFAQLGELPKQAQR